MQSGLKMQTLEAIPKLYKCEICSKSFDQNHKMMKHKRFVHGTPKIHQCNHCEKSFRGKGILDKHVKAVHENLKPLSVIIVLRPALKKDTY